MALGRCQRDELPHRRQKSGENPQNHTHLLRVSEISCPTFPAHSSILWVLLGPGCLKLSLRQDQNCSQSCLARRPDCPTGSQSPKMLGRKKSRQPVCFRFWYPAVPATGVTGATPARPTGGSQKMASQMRPVPSIRPSRSPSCAKEDHLFRLGALFFQGSRQRPPLWKTLGVRVMLAKYFSGR